MRLHGKPCKCATYVPSGKLWPSGDFSVGSRKVAGDERVELDTMQHYHSTGALDVPAGWDYGRYGLPSPESAVAVMSKYPGFYAEAAEGRNALNLTDAPNPHKRANRPESYGRQGMTGFGKKMTRSACTILERRYKGRLTFATVTMPTLPPEGRKALAECWSELVRQALQWLSRRLEAQGLPRAIVSVTEIQPKRLLAGNGGYLHLHMVWPNKQARPGHWAVDVLDFRAWVERFLTRNGLMVEGAWVNVNTQRVTKSAAAYLSKYMSKGGDVLEDFVAENGWTACPGQWWNLTKPVRDAVKAELVTGDDIGRVLNSLVEYAFNCDDFDAFWSLRHVDMEYEGRYINVGWCGIVKSEVQKDLLTMCLVQG